MATEHVRWRKTHFAPARPWSVLLVAILPLFCAALYGQEAVQDKSKQPVVKEAVIRYRLYRAREEALRQQNERVLAPLVSASRKLATNWKAATTTEKLKLIEKSESHLGLPAVTELPSSFLEGNIPFAVPKQEFLNLAYSEIEGVDKTLTSIDIYSPSTNNRHPVVVWFHGGGMTGGDKTHPILAVIKADYFVSKGFVFVSANYRLAPSHKFPAQAYDAAAAVSFLHDKVRMYGGDPQHVFLIGDSAGGQLVSIISTNEKYLEHYGKALKTIAGVVVLDIGSFNIPSILDQLGKNAPQMYYDFLGDSRENWIEASPLFHVEAGKMIPPMLLIHVAGREHHEQENRRFAAKMKQAGHSARVFEAKDRTHHTLAFQIGMTSDPATHEIMTFFSQSIR